MKDLEGDPLYVDHLEYATKNDGIVTAICITDVDGKVLPLGYAQALQLARKLIKAAME